MNHPSSSTGSRRFDLERHPAEIPLLIAVILVSITMWLVLTVSIIGLIYAALLGLFFFVSHLVFVAHVRGSAVRLGPDQLPELHARVHELAGDMGMAPPEAYVMQAGGALNALATRFLRSDMVILYSDLLEACGDNHNARDMIIAHELAHLRCGHLKWMWFILPGYLTPFLGSALARAREYTCDRYGSAAAGNPGDAARGLTILAAGPKLASRVNTAAFVRQRRDVNTGIMTIGEWLGTHPPLSKRIAALDDSTRAPGYRPSKGRIRAFAIVGLFGIISVGGTAVAVAFGSALMDEATPEVADAVENTTATPTFDGDVEAATTQVNADFAELDRFLTTNWTADEAPMDMSQVDLLWSETNPDAAFPRDPFDGLYYGYDRTGPGFQMFSSGPDGVPGTEDDLLYEGEFGATP